MKLRETPATFLAAAISASLFAAAGCSQDAPEPFAPGGSADASSASAGGAPGELARLESPTGAGSGEPNLFAAADGRVLMSWLEPLDGSGAAASTRDGRFALRFATLVGEAWTEPRTIVEGDDFFVNWADFPALIETDGTLVAHWLRKNGGPGTAYDVNIARSIDGGTTWGEATVPHADRTPTEHGFVSLVPEPDGGFSAIWLDGRDFVNRSDEYSPEMSLRSTRFDAAGAQGEVDLLDGRICDCCQTSATYVGDTLVAVYRDRSAEEIRDIYSVRRTEDGWQEPVRVGRDDWQIPGCPVNGPAIAASAGTAAVAWFTLRDGDPEIRVAFTDDAGAHFSDPILLARGEADGIDAGSPRQVAQLADASRESNTIPLGRVDITWIDDSRVAVTWMAARGAQADIVLRTVDLEGNLGKRHTLATTSSQRASGFPRMVRSADRLVVAWTDASAAGDVRIGTRSIESIR